MSDDRVLGPFFPEASADRHPLADEAERLEAAEKIAADLGVTLPARCRVCGQEAPLRMRTIAAILWKEALEKQLDDEPLTRWQAPPAPKTLICGACRDREAAR